MKHFVLLHNIIMMAQANVMNSVQPWFETELADLRFELSSMVHSYQRNHNKLTDYQVRKLLTLIDGITSVEE